MFSRACRGTKLTRDLPGPCDRCALALALAAGSLLGVNATQWNYMESMPNESMPNNGTTCGQTTQNHPSEQNKVRQPLCESCRYSRSCRKEGSTIPSSVGAILGVWPPSGERERARGCRGSGLALACKMAGGGSERPGRGGGTASSIDPRAGTGCREGG